MADVAGVDPTAAQRAEDRRAGAGGEVVADGRASGPAARRSVRRDRPCVTCRPCRGAPGSCPARGRRRGARAPAPRRSAGRERHSIAISARLRIPVGARAAARLDQRDRLGLGQHLGGRRRDLDELDDVDVDPERMAVITRRHGAGGSRALVGSPQTRPYRRVRMFVGAGCSCRTGNVI